MTDNTTELTETKNKLEELLTFPTTITFKFIGENIESLPAYVENFFKDDMKLEFSISKGKTSRTGKYLTLNVKVTVPSSNVMIDIYEKGSQIPHVMHVL
ncbi:MAG: DUF493 domain-containing protein [Succinivibrionaceae bacterium]